MVMKSNLKGFTLWCTDLKPPRCIISKDVIFNEAKILRSHSECEDDI